MFYKSEIQSSRVFTNMRVLAREAKEEKRMGAVISTHLNERSGEAVGAKGYRVEVL